MKIWKKMMTSVLTIGVMGQILPAVTMHAAPIDNREMVGFATAEGGTKGGAGGQTVHVYSAREFRDAVVDNAPRTVYVHGTMNMDELFEQSPGVRVEVGSNKSIIGYGMDAKIIRGGLRMRNASQIIIRNLEISNVLSYAPGETPDGNGGVLNRQPGEFTEIDAIDIETSTHIWIDGNEFKDDPWMSEQNRGISRHDGFVDIKRGSDLITVSHNIFSNHDKVGLVGHSDANSSQDMNRLRVTYYANWYRGARQRMPRVRFGRVHVVNNYYEDIISYGVGVGAGAKLIVEANYFENTRRAWGFADGVPVIEGNLLALGNHLQNSTFDPDIPGRIDWKPSTFYPLNPMNAEDVKAYVSKNAGVRPVY